MALDLIASQPAPRSGSRSFSPFRLTRFFCLLTETSTSIVLNVERKHQPMLPPKRDAARPAARKRKA